jgi:thiol-disulfide isomerase/thioredoxin
LADVKDGKLDIDVESPVTVELGFDTAGVAADKLPFASAAFSAMMKLPGAGGTYLMVTDGSDADANAAEPGKKLRITDLTAGEFVLSVATRPKPDAQNLPDAGVVPINPGAFRASQTVSLKAGESKSVEFHYVPLDVTAYKGDRTAVLRIAKADGAPAAGRSVSVTWHDGHYGSLPVFSGVVPDSGEIAVKGITDRVAEGVGSEPYTVFVDKQRVGVFRLAGKANTEPFPFTVPPGPGDVAPDVELVNIATGDRAKLSDFRGKVVCLEFWATWCGPCREPMRKLNQSAADRRDAWKDKVAVVALSIDETAELVKPDIAARGLTNLDHYWSGSQEANGWQSPAARAFAVSGVPTSFLIGADGKILWRGHPADNSDGKDLPGRIEAAIPR